MQVCLRRVGLRSPEELRVSRFVIGLRNSFLGASMHTSCDRSNPALSHKPADHLLNTTWITRGAQLCQSSTCCGVLRKEVKNKQVRWDPNSTEITQGESEYVQLPFDV